MTEAVAKIENNQIACGLIVTPLAYLTVFAMNHFQIDVPAQGVAVIAPTFQSLCHLILFFFNKRSRNL